MVSLDDVRNWRKWLEDAIRLDDWGDVRAVLTHIDRAEQDMYREEARSVCRVHDEDDVVPGRICGRPLPCRDHE